MDVPANPRHLSIRATLKLVYIGYIYTYLPKEQFNHKANVISSFSTWNVLLQYTYLCYTMSQEGHQVPPTGNNRAQFIIC